MKYEYQPKTDPHQLLDLRDLSYFFCIRLHEAKQIGENDLPPYVMIGPHKRWMRKDVELWLDARRTKELSNVIGRYDPSDHKPSGFGPAENCPDDLVEFQEKLLEYHGHTLQPCVYFLTKGADVVYVGQTCSLAARIQTHREAKKFDRVFYLPTEEGKLLSTERHFILLLEPVLNKIRTPSQQDDAP